METDLRGRRALVVGRGGPLARACADELAAEGAATDLVEELTSSFPHPLDEVDVVVRVVAPESSLPIGEVDEAAWEKVARALDETVDLYQRCVPGMQRRSWGRIVYVGSTLGKSLGPGRFGLDHVLGTALLGLHRTLSHDLGPSGITVNSVLFGGREVGGAGAIDDVAGLVALLASARVGNTIGAVITVDGGATAGLF